MSFSPEQIQFAHELKLKLSAVRPALDDEAKAAQFHRAFGERFAGVESEELFAAEFEHILASIRVKEAEKSEEPGA